MPSHRKRTGKTKAKPRKLSRPKHKSKPKAKPISTLEAKRDALPFFSKGRRGVPASWWNVQPTGNYGDDVETGLRYAAAVLPMMWHVGGRTSLSWIMEAMFEAVSKRRGRRTFDKLSGIEIGFMRGIGDLLATSILTACVAGQPSILENRERVPKKMFDGIVELSTLFATASWERGRKLRAEIEGSLH